MTLIAAIQLASTKDVKANVDKVIQYIQAAAQIGAQIAVLSEEFATLGLSPEERLAIAEPYQAGPIQAQLARTAKENGIGIVGGTLPIQASVPGKVFASTLVWDAQGECVGRYDKIHLFDVRVEGEEAYSESSHIQPGEQIVVLNTPLGKMGIAICYDLRFPELFRALMMRGAEFIVVPSAFTFKTGVVHWEILLKARAIENLCYIVAPNQSGLRLNGHPAYGHSMIIGPWGETIDALESGSGIIFGKIELDKLIKIRERFPALTHKRM